MQRLGFLPSYPVNSLVVLGDAMTTKKQKEYIKAFRKLKKAGIGMNVLGETGWHDVSNVGLLILYLEGLWPV